jgi:hypothetical protein
VSETDIKGVQFGNLTYRQKAFKKTQESRLPFGQPSFHLPSLANPSRSAFPAPLPGVPHFEHVSKDNQRLVVQNVLTPLFHLGNRGPEIRLERSPVAAPDIQHWIL